MPAYREEIDEAIREGVKIQDHLPAAFYRSGR